jgi:colicin import membrane protein
MKTGLTISAIGHAAVLLWGLVSFASKPLEAPPVDSLPVDIISATDFSQLTAGDRNAPKAETPKPLVDKVAEQPKPVEAAAPKVVDKPEIVTAAAVPEPPQPPTPVPQAKPAPPKPEPKPEPKPQEALKPPEPKPQEALKPPEPKPQVDPIGEMLKKDETKKPDKKEQAKPAPAKKPPPPQPKFDANRIAALLDKREPQRQAALGAAINRTPSLGVPSGNAPTLSQNELDALRARLRECWILPAGAADAKDLIVQVRILFKQDGSLAAEPSLLNRGTSPYFQVAAESALRAVRRCAPFSFLPIAKYEVWKDIEVTFDPRDMFRG